MPNFDDLCAALKLRRCNETYESIATSYPKRIKRAHIWKIINEGWEPDDSDIRDALGLPQKSMVISTGGQAIPSGAQAHHALQCRCATWFIPNHPLRKRCFDCSPYRGKIRR